MVSNFCWVPSPAWRDVEVPANICVIHFLVLAQFHSVQIVLRKLPPRMLRACFDVFIFLSMFAMIEKDSENKLT